MVSEYRLELWRADRSTPEQRALAVMCASDAIREHAEATGEGYVRVRLLCAGIELRDWRAAQH